jgi:hypothetical protein
MGRQIVVVHREMERSDPKKKPIQKKKKRKKTKWNRLHFGGDAAWLFWTIYTNISLHPFTFCAPKEKGIAILLEVKYTSITTLSINCFNAHACETIFPPSCLHRF